MKNDKSLVCYSRTELAAQGSGKSRWSEVATLTDADLEAAIASDPDSDTLPNGEPVSLFTSEDIHRMRTAGLSRTDWTAIEQQTPDDLRAARMSDPDAALSVTIHGETPCTQLFTTTLLDFDPDVQHWLCQHDGNISARVNAAVREYMARHPEG
jgi:galactose mutarotase-like enzyme